MDSRVRNDFSIVIIIPDKDIQLKLSRNAWSQSVSQPFCYHIHKSIFPTNIWAYAIWNEVASG